MTTALAQALGVFYMVKRLTGGLPDYVPREPVMCEVAEIYNFHNFYMADKVLLEEEGHHEDVQVMLTNV